MCVVARPDHDEVDLRILDRDVPVGCCVSAAERTDDARGTGRPTGDHRLNTNTFIGLEVR
jgi:hypothetical protein